MTKTLHIGKTVADATGGGGSSPVELDLLQLIDSRALIQANSGGGKSYLLRLICEQAGPHVQTLVVDPEGEFATLREKIDMVLVGQTGEIPATVKTAPMLARRLTEIRASAVIDLYDLQLADRRAFVRGFLEALIAVPRSLWHPMLIVIDEAHLFCPDRSAGEAESTSAVIGLMTLGRKRGMCGVLATQRISKLHKDAAAEANNIFIGRTTLDIDQQRAGDVLGIGKAERLLLRETPPGQWHGYGPALNHSGVTVFKGAEVTTTHPKAGQRHQLTAPPASAAIKGVVAEIADLAKREPDEALTLEEAQTIIQRIKSESRQRVTQLERELNALTEKHKNASSKADPAVIEAAVIAAMKEARDQVDFEWRQRMNGILKRSLPLAGLLQQVIDSVETIRVESAHWRGLVTALKPLEPGRKFLAARTESTVGTSNPVQAPPRTFMLNEQHVSHDAGGAGGLPKGERAILTAIVQFNGCTREQLTVNTGYKRSSRDTYLQRLREKGFILTDPGGGDMIHATTEGVIAMGDYEPLPTGEKLREYWLNKLTGGERVLFDLLVRAYPDRVTRTQLSEATEYQRSSRDTYLQRLSARKLIESSGSGVKAADILFSSQ